jgi:hypothetical protein
VTELSAGPPTPPSEPPAELPAPPDEGHAVVPVWTRLGAFGLELVLVPCTFVFGWVGWWIIAWADGQTPSKFLLHQHVVNVEDGRLASFGRMAVREALGKGIGAVLVLGGLYFGVPVVAVVGGVYAVAGSALALFDPRRRTSWDRLARTVVVEGDPPPFVPAAPEPAEANVTDPVAPGTELA